jgi:phosphopantothenoylcysteine decarboxylase/phosphopantothenate--cysteine ligase
MQKTITLGVSGGIACYKSAEILRRLQDRGFDVSVVMTRSATRFVTPLTFGALSGNKVHVDMFDGRGSRVDVEGAFDHVFLAESTDLFLVAPATADCIARMANGIANDFLTTFHLAVTAPIVVAPAMNTRMWQHPSVQDNLAVLRKRGVRVIDPDVGEMACHTHGPGRLADVETIVDFTTTLLAQCEDLAGKKILVTAGPTVEDIDPVRFLSNRSSGKMGHAIAEAVRSRGGEVVFISGPTNLDFPGTIPVRSTREMRDAVLEHLPGVDVVIKAAAPLDFRPQNIAPQKIKKNEQSLDITFERTPDILSEIGKCKNGKLLVGFAAETENHVASAREKLTAKNLDLIVVNSVSGPDSAFGSDTNRASIIDRSGEREDLPLMSKQEMANRILDRVLRLFEERSDS